MTTDLLPGRRPDGLDVAITLGGSAGGAALVLGGLSYVHPETGAWVRDVVSTRLDVFVLLMFFVETTIIGSSVLAAMRLRALSWSDLGFRRPLGKRWYAAALVLALVVFPVLSLLIELALRRFDLERQDLTLLLGAMRGHPLSLAALIVLGCLVIPLFEEVLFRGVLFAWLRRRWGRVLAVAVSSLAFALAHGLSGTLVPLFVLGAFIALLYDLSGSLWPAVLAHGTNNGLAFAATFWI
ncbi:MAG: CPBP family intramembrane metalloprotease [Alphaproteobacteria bacterium]|nr:CPBP family intramembrane metalloprotease [Alphaproteobacteria bacterium]